MSINGRHIPFDVAIQKVQYDRKYVKHRLAFRKVIVFLQKLCVISKVSLQRTLIDNIYLEKLHSKKKKTIINSHNL